MSKKSKERNQARSSGLRMAGNVSLPSQTTSSGQISSHSNNHLECSEEYDSLTVPPHPLRIKPAGNMYTATENIKQATGFFMRLPDELIIQVLESLDAPSLQFLGCTCKALYAFSRFEDLWKTLCIEYELLSSTNSRNLFAIISFLNFVICLLLVQYFKCSAKGYLVHSVPLHLPRSCTGNESRSRSRTSAAD